MPTSNDEDLTGQRFGRWTVIGRAALPSAVTPKGKLRMWHCRCDCGTERDVRGINLRSGATKSCGCLKRELFIKHRDEYAAQRKLKTYCIWNNKTDEVVAIDKTAKECAEILNITEESFRSIYSRYTLRGIGRWCILESCEEEEEEEDEQ